MTSKNTDAIILLAKSAMTGALGGLLFGFDTAVIVVRLTRLRLSTGSLRGSWGLQYRLPYGAQSPAH